ncbi:peptidoglycan editing factor PgeF [Ectothiorhodospiraceae bacterium 2226]|nr:peptidoglycan editing factor PgeF [Ectothiorhodospiraceae bacterium 2226]
MSDLPVFEADWPAPPGVRACTTTRAGGVSAPPYESLNLALHVGDDPQAVAANRARLREALALPGEPCWLNQVHGMRVAAADELCVSGAPRGRPGAVPPEADAAHTAQGGVVLAVLTADCLPVVFAARRGERLAVAHAGWRGLAAGVLEATVAAMQVPGAEILAWLGPAIGPRAFEVGPEVRDAFVAQDAASAGAFTPGPGDRSYADLYALARRRLARVGVTSVYGGGACTFHDPRFYSYRRAATTGRMATLVWRIPH